MTVLDKANAFIGHAEEVDEGYETTMRRNAFIAGWEAGFAKACEILHDFAKMVYEMMEAQHDESIMNARLTYKGNSGVKVEEEEYAKHNDMILRMYKCESQVRDWIKENYPQFMED